MTPPYVLSDVSGGGGGIKTESSVPSVCGNICALNATCFLFKDKLLKLNRLIKE